MKWTIDFLWHACTEWLLETYRSSHFYEVLKTASAEVAVLLFVFPLIDMLGKDDFKGKEKNWTLVLWSFGIGVLFILLAGYFARLEMENNEETIP